MTFFVKSCKIIQVLHLWEIDFTMSEKDTVLGGISPIFDKWNIVREGKNERNHVVSQNTELQSKIKKFLMRIGFVEVPIDVMNALANLIAVSLQGGRLKIGKAYAELSHCNLSEDALRTKISYYVEKNYVNMRDSVSAKFNCSLGQHFSGNKNFIVKLSSVFEVFGQDE